MNLSNPFHYIIICIIIAVIAAFLVLIIRWGIKKISRARLKLRCNLAYCRIEFIREIDKWGRVKKSNYKKAKSGEYCFVLDFFNEKDIQIAIRNPTIAFEHKNLKPHKLALPLIGKEKNVMISNINLPPRKLISQGGGTARIRWRDELDVVVMSKKVYFEGQLPSGKNLKISLLEKSLYNFLNKEFEDSIEISR